MKIEGSDLCDIQINHDWFLISVTHVYHVIAMFVRTNSRLNIKYYLPNHKAKSKRSHYFSSHQRGENGLKATNDFVIV